MSLFSHLPDPHRVGAEARKGFCLVAALFPWTPKPGRGICREGTERGWQTVSFGRRAGAGVNAAAGQGSSDT